MVTKKKSFKIVTQGVVKNSHENNVFAVSIFFAAKTKTQQVLVFSAKNVKCRDLVCSPTNSWRAKVS